MKNLSVYVHIPFCRQRCYYCDFVSSTNCSDTNMLRYVNAVKRELGLSDKIFNLKNYNLDTLYFGGGTPSLLKSDYFRSILEELFLIWPNFKGEMTFEANPNSISENLILDLKNMGFNRISIGIQSLNDATLSSVGRLHNANEAINALNLCNSYNLNISVDLMLGLPGQSKEDIFSFIDTVTKYENVNHISTYMLSVEEGTKLDKLVKEGVITVASDDEKVDLFDYASMLLKSKDFNRYEVSNFAKDGFESKHNSRYWELKDYLGLGISSHSLMGNKRFYNPSSFDDYYKSIELDKLAYLEEENLSDEDLEKEYIMLALRTAKGIDLNEFQEKFNIDFSKKYANEIEDCLKYLNINNNNISIKDEYLNTMNSIVLKFI